MWAKKNQNFMVDDLQQKNLPFPADTRRFFFLPPLQLESCTESLGFRFSVSVDFCFEWYKKKTSVVQ